ncbi:DUF899 family protein [Actinomycetospora sp. NBC_00405]|uniref:DUF899 family protein n=1 Tax=Actinomycetospora sp. NBC_00405 TaxID=2975952 RepID=UPI002E1DB564
MNDDTRGSARTETVGPTGLTAPADDAADAPGRPSVVDRATFTTAMDGLRAREKAHTREGDAIAAARRRLPAVEVDASLPLVDPDGPLTLLDAFEGRRQLIAYYFCGRPGTRRRSSARAAPSTPGRSASSPRCTPATPRSPSSARGRTSRGPLTVPAARRRRLRSQGHAVCARARATATRSKARMVVVSAAEHQRNRRW